MSKMKFAAAVAAVFVATCGVAIAVPVLTEVPEPSALPLVGLALAGLIAVSRKARK